MRASQTLCEATPVSADPPPLANKVGESCGAPQQKQGEGVRSVNTDPPTAAPTPLRAAFRSVFSVEMSWKTKGFVNYKKKKKRRRRGGEMTARGAVVEEREETS